MKHIYNIMIIMARYSEEHKRATRTRILAAADRRIKADGVAATSVEEVMRDAGLTVGGFYAHFPSKEALAREALFDGLARSVEQMFDRLEGIADPVAWARAMIRLYLAQAEGDALGQACPLTMLLADVARSDRDTRNAFGMTTNALLDRIAQRFPEVPGMTRREAVLAVYSSCIGAVMLARAVPSMEARRRILGNTETMLLRVLALDSAGEEERRRGIGVETSVSAPPR
jgi:TetR/AcrR family transcriptional regulator, transcriptional repressor for nem operon